MTPKTSRGTENLPILAGIVQLRGRKKKIRVSPYDTWRKCRHLIEAGGENPGIVVPKGQWHNLECLESGTFIMEGKDGAWEPLAKDEMLEL